MSKTHRSIRTGILFPYQIEALQDRPGSACLAEAPGVSEGLGFFVLALSGRCLGPVWLLWRCLGPPWACFGAHHAATTLTPVLPCRSITVPLTHYSTQFIHYSTQYSLLITYSPCRLPGSLPGSLPGAPRQGSCMSKRQALRAKNWWAREDLNFRPHAYQARALTN